MKIFFIILLSVSSTLGTIYLDRSYLQQNEDTPISTTAQDILAATNHNWSNQ